MGLDFYVFFKQAFPEGDPNNRERENVLSISSTASRQIFEPVFNDCHSIKGISLQDLTTCSGEQFSPEQAEALLTQIRKTYKAAERAEFPLKRAIEMLEAASAGEGFIVW